MGVRDRVSHGVGLSQSLAQVGLGERLLREGIDGGSHGCEGKRASRREKFEVHGRSSLGGFRRHGLVFCF